LAGDVARFNTVLAGAADPFTWSLRLLGLIATLAATVLVTGVARRALAEPPSDRVGGGPAVDPEPERQSGGGTAP
jgi:hypothetical protein